MTLVQAPNPHILQVALSNVHLFEAPPAGGEAPNLLAIIADITGIPPLALKQVERRIAATGSLTPLRELFGSAAVPKADGLRYELTVKQTQAREALSQRLSLTMASGRGQVAVQLSVTLSRRPSQRHGAERQTAHIVVSYRVESASRHHAFKQELRIAGDKSRVVVHTAQAA